jgi:hypothetical protein
MLLFFSEYGNYRGERFVNNFRLRPLAPGRRGTWLPQSGVRLSA